MTSKKIIIFYRFHLLTVRLQNINYIQWTVSLIIKSLWVNKPNNLSETVQLISATTQNETTVRKKNLKNN